MKNKIQKFNLLLVIIGVLIVSSCQEYLDLKPASKLDQSYVYSTVAGAESTLLGVYAQLTFYQNGPIRAFGLEADDVAANYNGALDDRMRSAQRFDLKPTNLWLDEIFSNFYIGIERANVCITEIPKMQQYTNGTPDEIKALKEMHGEALTLRALFYFELVRNWGDIPASFIPSIEQEDLYLEKTDRHIIYNKILEDLVEAQELLSWRTEVSKKYERFTKGSAKALRARIALFAGGYSLRASPIQMKRQANYLDYYKIVKKECDELMQNRGQHTLNPAFEGVFMALNSFEADPYGEVLLEIGFSPNYAGTLGYFDGPRYILPGSTTNGGAAQIYILPTYFYKFDSLDVRRDVTAAPYSVDFAANVRKGAALNLIPSGKFRLDWQNPRQTIHNQFTGVNWPVIRFSDVLLMFAEAENEIINVEGGDLTPAIAAYEEVRRRGFQGNESLMGATPTEYGDFLTAVQEERLFEFGAEGIRKHDLIRWDMLGDKIVETQANLLKIVNLTAPYDKIPNYMYYKNNSWDLIWGNSFYKPTPSPAPSTSIYTRVNWKVSMSAISALVANYGKNFELNKDEIFPIPQNAVNANPKLR
jgi:hypothetical protein